MERKARAPGSFGQAALDEMDRRPGDSVGPGIQRLSVSEAFRSRFAAAYAAKPRDQDTDEFARGSVDAWPEGTPAWEVEGAWAREPFSVEGTWPGFLRPAG